MPPPPILFVAHTLGVQVSHNRARCFNVTGHKHGTDLNPSLTFNPTTNRYKCYSCGVAGDTIALVRAVLGCDYRQARDRLDQMSLAPGAANPEQPQRPTCPAQPPSERMLQILQELVWLGAPPIANSPGGKYLQGRHLQLDVAKKAGVVELKSPARVERELRKEFSAGDLRAAGLLMANDRFIFSRHPLLFPYLSNGRAVYVQGRAITGDIKPKEISLAGSIRILTPYNGDALRGAPAEVVVCEGPIDTLSALQLGAVAVGVPGVTRFDEAWFEQFRGVQKVLIAFDNDHAGQRQGQELRARFRRQRIPADLMIPKGAKDINELLFQSYSPENTNYV